VNVTGWRRRQPRIAARGCAKIEEQAMRTVFVAAAVFSTLIGATIDPSMVLAQQKTVRACRDEWRANKDENQRNGITEKAYVDKCRAGVATTAAPTTRRAPATSTPSPSAAPATGRAAPGVGGDRGHTLRIADVPTAATHRGGDGSPLSFIAGIGAGAVVGGAAIVLAWRRRRSARS